ncbi:hypothetical protein MTO96_049557 [Rhipicephalus appendiculatus]
MVATNEHGTAASSPSGVGINAPMGPMGPYIDDEDDGGAENAFAAAAAPVVVFAPAPVAIAAPASKVSPAATFKRLPRPLLDRFVQGGDVSKRSDVKTASMARANKGSASDRVRSVTAECLSLNLVTSALFLAAVLVPAAVWAVPAVPASAVTNRFFTDGGQGAYQYGYDWTFPEGEGAFQRESGDAEGRKQGSYGLKDTDGRVRIVSYIADEGGFRVSVSTNEPGTKPSSPADALFQVPQGPYQATAYEAPKTYQPVQPQVQTKTSQTVAAVPVAVTAPKVVPVAVTAPKVAVAVPTRHVIPATYHYYPHPHGPVIYSQPTGVIPVHGRVVYGL